MPQYNSEALKDAHKLFVNTGYDGSIDEFSKLLSTNKDALKDAHKLFTDTGYDSDINSFSELLGVKKKAESSGSQPKSESGSSAMERFKSMRNEETKSNYATNILKETAQKQAVIKEYKDKAEKELSEKDTYTGAAIRGFKTAGTTAITGLKDLDTGLSILGKKVRDTFGIKDAELDEELESKLDDNQIVAVVRDYQKGVDKQSQEIQKLRQQAGGSGITENISKGNYAKALDYTAKTFTESLAPSLMFLNPMTATMSMGKSVGDEMEQAKSEGRVPNATDVTAGAIKGAAEYALTAFLGVGKVTKKAVNETLFRKEATDALTKIVQSSFGKKVATTIGEEGFEEGLTQVVNNGVDIVLKGDKTKGWFDGVPDNIIVGMFGGGTQGTAANLLLQRAEQKLAKQQQGEPTVSEEQQAHHPILQEFIANEQPSSKYKEAMLNNDPLLYLQERLEMAKNTGDTENEAKYQSVLDSLEQAQLDGNKSVEYNILDNIHPDNAKYIQYQKDMLGSDLEFENEGIDRHTPKGIGKLLWDNEHYKEYKVRAEKVKNDIDLLNNDPIAYFENKINEANDVINNSKDEIEVSNAKGDLYDYDNVLADLKQSLAKQQQPQQQSQPSDETVVAVLQHISEDDNLALVVDGQEIQVQDITPDGFVDAQGQVIDPNKVSVFNKETGQEIPIMQAFEQEQQGQQEQQPVKPKKIYHYTSKPFTGLPTPQKTGIASTYGNEPMGTFYHTDKGVAEQAVGSDKQGKQGRLIEAEYNPKNPLVTTIDSPIYVEVETEAQHRAVEQFLKDGIQNETLTPEMVDEINAQLEQSQSFEEFTDSTGLGDIINPLIPENITNILKEQGYDAVEFTNNGDIVILDQSAVSEIPTDKTHIQEKRTEIESIKEQLSKIKKGDNALNQKERDRIKGLERHSLSTKVRGWFLDGGKINWEDVKRELGIKEGEWSKYLGIASKTTGKTIDQIAHSIGGQYNLLDQSNDVRNEIINILNEPRNEWYTNQSKEDVDFIDNSFDIEALEAQLSKAESELGYLESKKQSTKKETDSVETVEKATAIFGSLFDAQGAKTRSKILDKQEPIVKDIFHNFDDIMTQLGYKKSKDADC